MEPGEHPTSFGLFKPTGHVVVALPRGTDLDAMQAALAQAGLSDVQRLSAEQMLAQADQDLANASPIGAIGQELNLVKAQRELAAQGNSFMVIKAADDDEVERLTAIALRFKATRAQRYGRFLIEELIDVGPDDEQVFESSDRGLDSQAN
jgi:hypothetical protein